MTATARTTDVWDFKRDDQGRWHWRRQTLMGELLLEGKTTFVELDECFADATRHGYVTPVPFTQAADTAPSRRTYRRGR